MLINIVFFFMNYGKICAIVCNLKKPHKLKHFFKELKV